MITIKNLELASRLFIKTKNKYLNQKLILKSFEFLKTFKIKLLKFTIQMKKWFYFINKKIDNLKF